MLKYQRFISAKSQSDNKVTEDEKMLKLINEPARSNGLDNEIRISEQGKFDINCWRKIEKDEMILKHECTLFNVDSAKLEQHLKKAADRNF